MTSDSSSFLDLTQGVSARLATLRSGAPDVTKSFNELGRAAMVDGALTKETKEMMALALALALGAAARCDP